MLHTPTGRSFPTQWRAAVAGAFVLGLAGAVPPAGAGGIPDPGSRGVDWEAVRGKVSRYAWARATVREWERQVDGVARDFPEPPVGVAGWAHDYYCEKDAGKLRYDPRKPHEHVCTRCGAVYSGGRHDEAWVDATYKRIHGAARAAGALYRTTGDTRRADYGRRTLLWFAANIGQFSVHGKHAGKGRIMGQSLCEATSMVDLALAYWDLYPLLAPDERERIARDLLLPAAELIHKQTGAIHNIHSWHNAAVGLIGLACGEARWVEAALSGPYGLKAQLARGVVADGFWFEGSIGYHFYTLRSLQDFTLALRARQLAPGDLASLRRMYVAPIRYACGDFQLPSINDGWSGSRLTALADYYEFAAGLWPDDPVIVTFLAWCSRTGRSGGAEALLHGPATLPPPPAALPRVSALLDGMGYAILRGARRDVLLKYGPYGGGHDHLDRLNLILFAGQEQLFPDTGTAGYGIRLNAWYRSPAAHNLVVVDGKPQARCGGYLVSFATNRVEAGVKEAYPGVDLRRTLTLANGVVGDVVTARSDEAHTYDLFYHVRGTLRRVPDGLAPVTAIPGGGAGYTWLTEIRGGAVGTAAAFELAARDSGERLILKTSASPGLEVYTGLCPDNPADRSLAFILLRIRGQTATWRNELR